MAFSKEQLERYSRQTALPQLGEAGQRKLLAARVLTVGAGGLGSAALMYLAAAGVGALGIADFDDVDISNLQRQIIHRASGVGTPKTLSAKRTLLEINPEINIITHDCVIDEGNIAQTISGYDLVIDACDNFATKYLINDACVRGRVPFIHAGVSGYSGQIFTCIPGVSACLRCILPQTPDEPEKRAVFGPAVGVLGCLQAAEAIKLITGAGEPLAGRVLFYDALAAAFTELPFERDARCRVCSI